MEKMCCWLRRMFLILLVFFDLIMVSFPFLRIWFVFFPNCMLMSACILFSSSVCMVCSSSWCGVVVGCGFQ